MKRALLIAAVLLVGCSQLSERAAGTALHVERLEAELLATREELSRLEAESADPSLIVSATGRVLALEAAVARADSRLERLDSLSEKESEANKAIWLQVLAVGGTALNLGLGALGKGVKPI